MLSPGIDVAFCFSDVVSFLLFFTAEVVVVDPVPLPVNFGKNTNTNIRAITTARKVWLF